MLKMVLFVIGILMALLGVIMVYDARILTKKFFSFGDQNEATSGFKILGFLLSIVGVLIIFFAR